MIEEVTIKFDSDKLSKAGWAALLKCELPEEFILKYWNKFQMSDLVECQKLPESFLEDHFKDFYCLEIMNLCSYQNLSDDFILKHIDELWIGKILKRKDLSLSEDTITYLKMKVECG